MQKLASGDFAVVLPGLGRADEVGDMAQAVETFKIRTKQKADDEAAAKMRQEVSAADARKTEMNKLADEFEGAVGRIIDTVSAASTELETAARTLTATAEQSQQLTDVVAAASEDASANVQSVASASEQMTSSGARNQPAGAEFRPDRQRSGGAGAGDHPPGRRVVEGGQPHRRCDRTDLRDRAADQSSGAQRHH